MRVMGCHWWVTTIAPQWAHQSQTYRVSSQIEAGGHALFEVCASTKLYLRRENIYHRYWSSVDRIEPGKPPDGNTSSFSDEDALGADSNRPGVHPLFPKQRLCSPVHRRDAAASRRALHTKPQPRGVGGDARLQVP